MKTGEVKVLISGHWRSEGHLGVVAAAHGRVRLWEVLGVQVDDSMAGAEVADDRREGHRRQSVPHDLHNGAVAVGARRLCIHSCYIN